MEPTLQFRNKRPLDIEDLSLHFVEEELGRFDAKKNWEQIKSKGEAQTRIQNFLSRLNLESSPHEVAEYLDRFFVERSGRWR